MVKNLKLLRDKAGISQAKLAEIAGISQQAINKYENTNTEPDIATLIKIANYFNTSVDYLIGNTEIDHKIEKVTYADLNNDELEVMEDFRSVGPKGQIAVIQTLKALKINK
ncbi:MAG: helix-turn-helix transcriptional regulator [Bacillota bacterium]|nr:helix-turn-helix transcriptional regulator [Bacillota bacterium]